MFLRKNRRTKNGKPHIYWSLVETIRTPKGPRQRVVGYLGDLNEEREDLYRGLVSEEVLEWLRQRGTFYLVGTPKGMLKKFESDDRS